MKISDEFLDLASALTQIATLQAEIERLREALAEMIQLAEPNIYPQPDKADSGWAILGRARAALQPASDSCKCFGDLGLHASTHGNSAGQRCCDLCGRPVAEDSRDVLTAVNAALQPDNDGEGQ